MLKNGSQWIASVLVLTFAALASLPITLSCHVFVC
jgi:hypothetical protein